MIFSKRTKKSRSSTCVRYQQNKTNADNDGLPQILTLKVDVAYQLISWAVHHFFNTRLLVFMLCSLFYDPGPSILFSIESTSGLNKNR